MPQVFKIGAFWVYFWTNEGKPIEPIHVHVSEGAPSAYATKIWITQSGKCLLCHNNSKIPQNTLRKIISIIESQSELVIQKWQEYFGEVYYYC